MRMPPDHLDHIIMLRRMAERCRGRNRLEARQHVVQHLQFTGDARVAENSTVVGILTMFVAAYDVDCRTALHMVRGRLMEIRRRRAMIQMEAVD